MWEEGGEECFKTSATELGVKSRELSHTWEHTHTSGVPLHPWEGWDLVSLQRP